jgi:3-hexulose-6-phosphate synthase
MALLQAALDTLLEHQTINIATQIHKHVDIIELGTPCIKMGGIMFFYKMNNHISVLDMYCARLKKYAEKIPTAHFAKEVENQTPTLLLADLKTMDAGEYEAEPFFNGGASIVTVMSAADEGTIQGVVNAGKKYGGKTQVDFLNCIHNINTEYLQWLHDIGVGVIGIHTGLDQQAKGKTPFEDLRNICRIKEQIGSNMMVSVAGGIKKDTIKDVISAGADIVVAGAAIYGADNPGDATEELREAMG